MEIKEEKNNEPIYYPLEGESEGNYYLKVEFIDKGGYKDNPVYKFNLIISLGKEQEPLETDIILTHKMSIDTSNEDLRSKLEKAFQNKPGIKEYNITTRIEDIEGKGIPINKTDMFQFISLRELRKLGKKTLKNFDGDASNRIIYFFERIHPGNGKNIFLGWLACLSSVMGIPIIVIVKGDPGTGKTQITSIIKDSIPTKYIIKLNNATESSLFGRGNIEGTNYPDKKIFYLGDLGDKNAMTHTAPYRKHIRELLSDGETTRELSDTNKPKEGDRPVLSETLTGYPTMIYSTVRDGEIEQQETDRAIELTPNLSKINHIKHIIIHAGNPDAKITKELTALKKRWYPKLQGIFEYLTTTPKHVLLPWDLTQEDYGLRDTKTIVSITRKLAMINQHHRKEIGEYIIASELDLALALEYVQDGGLERTRLQQVYDKYGLTKSFTRDDVVSMFSDSYSSPQASTSVYRYILKPAIEDKDDEDIPVLTEIREYRAHQYQFKRKPSNEIYFEIPYTDYSFLKKEYPNLPWEEL